MTRLLWATMLLLMILPAAASAAEPRPIVIGYLEQQDDARYAKSAAYAGIVFRTLGRPWSGAELGLEDAKAVGGFTGLDFALQKASADSVDQLAAQVRRWTSEQGIHFVLTDLPAETLLPLADAVADLPVVLLNISEPADSLRGTDCRADIADVYPSQSMLSDALVQFLVSKNWRRIAALVGPAPEDQARLAALQRSAAKFGAEIKATKPFVLSGDPRRRDENNVALMTADIDADVLFVADSEGEFGRDVPYRTNRPMLVVGDAGLTPTAWHWAWRRYGAPQVQHRFEALASPWRMNGSAWAAWVAVKAVAQAAMRAGSDDYEAIKAYLFGDEIRIDGSKGTAMSFRPWDHQLRQPVLLAGPDAVVAEAPLEQFLHQSNELDTLGRDAPETDCHVF